MSDFADELGLPEWLRPIHAVLDDVRGAQLTTLPDPPSTARHAAVLICFGEGPHGPDVLLIERSHDMRDHAGQVAFPGGAQDPGDDGPIGAALREATEETGLDPSGVDVFGTLPALWLPPSDFAVTPVLAWWRKESPVSVVDEAEVAAVLRVPVDLLLDPANRFSIRHPSGFVGPAFRLSELVLWGFTGGLLSRLFDVVGWTRPWDPEVVEDLPPYLVELSWRTYGDGGPPPAQPGLPDATDEIGEIEEGGSR